MAPSNDELRNIAERAEKDVNTYQAKTGAARGKDIDEAGVDTRVEKNFPGGKVAYNEDHIRLRDRPLEGRDVDLPAWYSRPSEFEGAGGPELNSELNRRDRGGENDPDVVSSSALDVEDTGKARGGYTDPLDQGDDSKRSNVGRNPPGVGGSHFKGADYELPEDVPDSRAEQGNIPPENIRRTHKGRENLG